MNGCAGWSCVETVDGAGRVGATVYTEAPCNWCHGGEGTFLVHGNTVVGVFPEVSYFSTEKGVETAKALSTDADAA